MPLPVPDPLLQGHSMAEGELLLSSNIYYSPMHLICGQFWLSFPGLVRHGRSRGPAGGRQTATTVPSTAGTVSSTAGGKEAQDGYKAGARLPAYICRKGFDVAAGALVPLHRALEGFD